MIQAPFGAILIDPGVLDLIDGKVMADGHQGCADCPTGDRIGRLDCSGSDPSRCNTRLHRMRHDLVDDNEPGRRGATKLAIRIYQLRFGRIEVLMTPIGADP
jgi:hypothetical protein